MGLGGWSWLHSANCAVRVLETSPEVIEKRKTLHRGWGRRVVADANDRPVFSVPGDEELRYAPFRIWIISRAIDRVIRRIDGLLHVNNEQGGGAEFRHDNPRKENWTSILPQSAGTPPSRVAATRGNRRD